MRRHLLGRAVAAERLNGGELVTELARRKRRPVEPLAETDALRRRHACEIGRSITANTVRLRTLYELRLERVDEPMLIGVRGEREWRQRLCAAESEGCRWASCSLGIGRKLKETGRG